MNPEGLVGGLYTPQDAHVDPYDVTAALVAQAREDGCVVLVNHPVEAIRAERGAVTGVEGPGGFVEAPAVVVAAGAWTASLLRPLGVALPLKPYRVQALVTAPVPGLGRLPLFHELPGGFYLRPEGEGLLLGDGTEHAEADPEAYNPEPDFALYTDLASWLARRVPAASTATVIRGWASLCQATPDRLPLVGPVPEVEGLHVLAGFNGLGVMRGPALGQALAASLRDGTPAVALDPLRPDRFGELEAWPIREGFTLR
jgi:sarcosine oxidase subunit beta